MKLYIVGKGHNPSTLKAITDTAKLEKKKYVIIIIIIFYSIPRIGTSGYNLGARTL